MRRAARVLAGLLASSATALAQSAPPAGPAAGAPDAPSRAASAQVDCADKAALYEAGGKRQLWVSRQGILDGSDPLRPLTGDRFVVYQVAVGGRLASAYGRDPTALRQGPAPDALAASHSGRIRWNPRNDALPQSLKLVADDGAVLDLLRFQTCGDAPPAVARPAAAESRPQRRGAGPQPARSERPAIALPQGAIPSIELRQR